MNCPKCKARAYIIDTRSSPTKRRRYKCNNCGERFTTYEISKEEYKELLRYRKGGIFLDKEELIFRIKRNKLRRREAIVLISDFLCISYQKAEEIYENEVLEDVI